ncbi:hypothetical protein CE91St41_35340 [Oscillospiraceae bacterium]|nr:hypothetical protein CE91St40_35330 [Oscillospiraceae bacterium]BDF76645.1 hypothetical protein CE91St41_35340 [Oscillospiraceae bacterium]
MDKRALILFSRLPVPGRVKTRLMPPLSGAECAALQKAMTLDTAHTLAALGRDLFLFHSDEGAPALLDGLPRGARLFPQSGADLGERMYNAVAAVLAMGYGDCLLLGSDLPFLTAPEVAEAGRVLEGSDVVLCPSPDGGYWLIGMRRPFPPIFHGQRYGTGSVLDDALACCAAHGLRAGLGPVRRDLDTPEDLAWFLEELKAHAPTDASRTAAWLRAWQAGLSMSNNHL